MKIFWKTVTTAAAAATAASIITNAVCKCTELARKTFKNNLAKK